MIDLKKKFLIYGYGISGKSIAKYLKNRNSNYQIYDDNTISLKSHKVINKNLVIKNIKKLIKIYYIYRGGRLPQKLLGISGGIVL